MYKMRILCTALNGKPRSCANHRACTPFEISGLKCAPRHLTRIKHVCMMCLKRP